MYKAQTENAMIFVDYENVYITLDERYTGIQDGKLTILDKIRENYRNYIIKGMRLFCDFSNITDIIPALDTRFLELRHVPSINRGNKHKNAADISMAIDIINTLRDKPEISKYIIVSSDSDMMPIISELIQNNKQVEVICFRSNTNEDYQSVLARWGVNCIMIEDVLKLIEFQKMTREDYNQNLPKIKSELQEIYTDYKDRFPARIPSIREIRTSLEMLGYCKEDTADIVRYSFQEGILENDENETGGRIFKGVKVNL